MYTQCPECQIAFRVTAKVLQQASGNVRCGNCEHAFNALEFLSEDMPTGNFAADDPTNEPPRDELAETSRRLLETLDELAGPDDIRIEDTGVEWRVLDQAAVEAGLKVDDGEIRYDDNTPLPDDFTDEADAQDLTPQRRESDFREASAELEERQGDLALTEPEDWTEILEEFRDPALDQSDDDSIAVVTDQDDDLDVEELSEPRLLARDDDLTDEVPLIEEHLVADVGDSETDEEPEIAVDDESAAVIVDLDAGTGPADESELDPEDSVDADSAAEVDDDDEFAAIDADLQADAASGEVEALQLAATDDDVEDMDESPVDAIDEEPEAESDVTGDDVDDESVYSEDPSEDEFEDDREDEAEDHDIDADEGEWIEDDSDDRFSEEDESVDMDEDVDAEEDSDEDAHEEPDFAATLVGMENPEDLFDENSGEVETIIMEGEFVRSEIERELLSNENKSRAKIAEPGNLKDTYALVRAREAASRFSFDMPSTRSLVIVGVLGLLLLGQVIHQSRQSLATYGFFNSTIAPLYRAVGSTVTPDWDIRGWQFEATSGSVDEAEANLTITTRISNQSTQSLPFPLIHVSLTNRFEDVMGSRVLEPGDYLPVSEDPSTPVEPGVDFTASIVIESPSPEATGFKLNVCYRVEPGTVRCAIQDFRN